MSIHNEPHKIISIRNLSLSVGSKNIFSNINFDINKNDLINIQGPNGSGKTSLIKTIMDFQKIQQGTINHFGKKLYGYVPQYFNPISHMRITVFEFLKLSNITNIKLNQAIEITEIERLLNKNLINLSGGELRKTLITKALLHSKEILFLDEPTCWLDSSSQQRFYNLIQELNKNFDFAIVLISHDTFLNRDFFNKTIFMV